VIKESPLAVKAKVDMNDISLFEVDKQTFTEGVRFNESGVVYHGCGLCESTLRTADLNHLPSKECVQFPRLAVNNMALRHG
jgi:hypothetical protein